MALKQSRLCDGDRGIRKNKKYLRVKEIIT